MRTFIDVVRTPIWSVVALAFAACTATAAAAGDDAGACAEKEVLLMTLVEAHGSGPNRASELLAAQGGALTKAREACANGHTGEAVAAFDQLIAELSRSTTQMAAGR